MPKIYRTAFYAPMTANIDVFELVRETEKSFWLKSWARGSAVETRKSQSDFRFFRTWKEARAYVIRRCEDEAATAAATAQRARELFEEEPTA